MLTHRMLTGSIAGLVLAAAPLAAQQPSTRPVYSLTPYVGYIVFGDFLKGPIGATLSNANGAVYGAQLGVNLTKNLALIGNVALASTDLEVGVPFLGGVSVGHSSAWLYDGGIQLSLPVGTLTPFMQVGAGAIRHDVENGPVKSDATNLALNAGLGVDIAFGRNLGLRLMAKDYVGRFDFKEATQLNLEGKQTHNWALSAGLKLGF